MGRPRKNPDHAWYYKQLPRMAPKPTDMMAHLNKPKKKREWNSPEVQPLGQTRILKKTVAEDGTVTWVET